MHLIFSTCLNNAIFFSFLSFLRLLGSNQPLQISRRASFIILLSWVVQSDYVHLIQGKISLCPVLVNLLLPWWNTWGKMFYRFLLTPSPWEVRSTCYTCCCLFTSRSPMLFKTLHGKRQPCILFSPSSKKPPIFDPLGSSLIAWPTPHHLQIETKLQPVSPWGGAHSNNDPLMP